MNLCYMTTLGIGAHTSYLVDTTNIPLLGRSGGALGVAGREPLMIYTG
jgi:hypothetical protein